MTFISYAQNFEDVILNRALKDVKKGFYIDVGANDPVVDSVTKAFYDKGWRGINIEPVRCWFEKLEQDRLDDVNLQVAAGTRKGKATFYEVIGTGLSTMDKATADRHAKEHGFEVNEYKVSTVSLSSVCKQYVDSDIHFLKIDVEGSEEKVLKGLDLNIFRPWIIMVESTPPLSQVEKYAEWEGMLLGANYGYCYFDGLNRFYIAKEHDELKAPLNVPPNIFDDFLFSGKGSSIFHGQLAQLQSALTNSDDLLQQAEVKAEQAEVKAEQAEVKAEQAEVKAEQAEVKAEQFHTELNQVYQSHSWRITAPIRRMIVCLRKLSPGMLKGYLKLFLQHAALYLNRRPRLKKIVLVVLNRFPYLKSHLRLVANNSHNTYSNHPMGVPIHDADLTPHAREIYANLKAAIEQQKRDH